MNLSKQDVELYYQLMWPLLFFANKKLNIIHGVKDVSACKNLTNEEKVQIRDALCQKLTLIDEYTKENPDRLSDENLAIVSSWKNVVSGMFYIERHLKKYTIFITDEAVYGVVGLRDEIESLVPQSYLPRGVKTILLPFKGQIIYDGIFQIYSVFFGGNITNRLNSTYLKAKQKGKIITSFEARENHDKKVVNLHDWTPEIQALMEKAQKLRAMTGSPEIYSPAFNLVRTSLQFALTSVNEPESTDKLHKELRKVNRALKQAENTIFEI
ncbi:MAG: hypothetical protein WC071_03975 [Victivallaceae bacterium]